MTEDPDRAAVEVGAAGVGDVLGDWPSVDDGVGVAVGVCVGVVVGLGEMAWAEDGDAAGRADEVWQLGVADGLVDVVGAGYVLVGCRVAVAPGAAGVVYGGDE